jgi:hypothetical protein
MTAHLSGHESAEKDAHGVSSSSVDPQETKKTDPIATMKISLKQPISFI